MNYSLDRYIRIYNADTWKIVKRIPAIEFGWSVLDFDYKGDKMVYCTWSSNLCLYSRANNDQQRLQLAGRGSFGIFSVK